MSDFKSDANTVNSYFRKMLQSYWPVRLVAGAVLLNGLFEVLYVLLVRIPGQVGISELLPFGLHYWSRSLGLVFGFALLYLSLNLFRRKRVAWWLAACSSTVVTLNHVYRVVVREWPWYTLLAPVAALVLGSAISAQASIHLRRTASTTAEPIE